MLGLLGFFKAIMSLFVLYYEKKYLKCFYKGNPFLCIDNKNMPCMLWWGRHRHFYTTRNFQSILLVSKSNSSREALKLLGHETCVWLKTFLIGLFIWWKNWKHHALTAHFINKWTSSDMTSSLMIFPVP